ncbi:MAG: hypothetical protein U5O39_13565 [Gammaproteobacteria bacterium]|nr:hypothetical protein [Gammaproteobacteria bacterium]
MPTYDEAGAKLASNRTEVLGTGDIVLRVRKPAPEDMSQAEKRTRLHVSYLDPVQRTRADQVRSPTPV